jgi:hypothetical protein
VYPGPGDPEPVTREEGHHVAEARWTIDPVDSSDWDGSALTSADLDNIRQRSVTLDLGDLNNVLGWLVSLTQS